MSRHTRWSRESWSRIFGASTVLVQVSLLVVGFIAQLQEIACIYKLGATLLDILWDRPVCGINDEKIQTSLLIEADLT